MRQPLRNYLFFLGTVALVLVIPFAVDSQAQGKNVHSDKLVYWEVESHTGDAMFYISLPGRLARLVNLDMVNSQHLFSVSNTSRNNISSNIARFRFTSNLARLSNNLSSDDQNYDISIITQQLSSSITSLYGFMLSGQFSLDHFRSGPSAGREETNRELFIRIALPEDPQQIRQMYEQMVLVFNELVEGSQLMEHWEFVIITPTGGQNQRPHIGVWFYGATQEQESVEIQNNASLPPASNEHRNDFIASLASRFNESFLAYDGHFTSLPIITERSNRSQATAEQFCSEGAEGGEGTSSVLSEGVSENSLLPFVYSVIADKAVCIRSDRQLDKDEVRLGFKKVFVQGGDYPFFDISYSSSVGREQSAVPLMRLSRRLFTENLEMRDSNTSDRDINIPYDSFILQFKTGQSQKEINNLIYRITLFITALSGVQECIYTLHLTGIRVLSGGNYVVSYVIRQGYRMGEDPETTRLSLQFLRERAEIVSILPQLHLSRSLNPSNTEVPQQELSPGYLERFRRSVRSLFVVTL